jgi:hypothetical protein
MTTAVLSAMGPSAGLTPTIAGERTGNGAETAWNLVAKAKPEGKRCNCQGRWLRRFSARPLSASFRYAISQKPLNDRRTSKPGKPFRPSGPPLDYLLTLDLLGPPFATLDRLLRLYASDVLDAITDGMTARTHLLRSILEELPRRRDEGMAELNAFVDQLVRATTLVGDARDRIGAYVREHFPLK